MGHRITRSPEKAQDLGHGWSLAVRDLLQHLTIGVEVGLAVIHTNGIGALFQGQDLINRCRLRPSRGFKGPRAAFPEASPCTDFTNMDVEDMIHDRKFPFRRVIRKGSGQPTDVAGVFLVHVLIGIQTHRRHLLEKNTSRDGTLVALQEFLHCKISELQLLEVKLFRTFRHVARFKSI